MFDACLGKNHGLKAEDVWAIEYRMLETMGCGKVKNDSDEFYNKVYANDSHKYGLDWDTFSKKLGFKAPPNIKPAVCIPAPAKISLPVFKLPPAVQVDPSYSSVAVKYLLGGAT